jgi:hypothetical protein
VSCRAEEAEVPMTMLLGRWALRQVKFRGHHRLHLRDDLGRKKADARISPMQAMYRVPGPTLD